jgi:hypothetical protein
MSGLINQVGARSGVISGDIYAHLDNCSETYGDITFGTLTGDSTNITQSGANVTLVKSGVYFITCTFNWTLNGSERYCFGYIHSVSGSYGDVHLSTCNDQVEYSADAATSYGGATATYVGTFAANDVIKFYYISAQDGNVVNRADCHASIFRIFN